MMTVLLQAPAVATDSDNTGCGPGDVVGHTPSWLCLRRPQFRETHVQCLQLLPESFALSLAPHYETSAAAAPDEVREAQEVKGRGPTHPSVCIARGLIAKTQ